MGKKSAAKINPYFYLVPSMLIFAVFLFYPFFKTIYLSLYKTNKMGEAKLFVGLENYKALLSSPSFHNSLKVTLIFVSVVVIGSMLLGLVAAVLCNKAFPGIRFFQHSVCASYGDRLQFCGNDLSDHAPSCSGNCK